MGQAIRIPDHVKSIRHRPDRSPGVTDPNCFWVDRNESLDYGFVLSRLNDHINSGGQGIVVSSMGASAVMHAVFNKIPIVVSRGGAGTPESG